ncbi:MAG: 4Fe-4S binding protein, partial [Clostridia bacterium]|nr:4Fe-4S binding protein [Clostridia bacterium]
MNNKKTDYSIVNQQQPRPVQAKKKPPFIRILRALIQLVSFIILPGLFISIFSSIGAIYSAIITGSFTWTEYAGRIVLVAAAFIITAIWGRFFCGFICSFGAMQDLVWLGGKHMPRKIKVPEKADRILKLLKFAV